MEENDLFSVVMRGVDKDKNPVSNRIGFESADELHSFMKDSPSNINYTDKITLDGKGFNVSNKGERGMFVGAQKYDNFIEKKLKPLLNSNNNPKDSPSIDVVKPTVLTGSIPDDHPLQKQLDVAKSQAAKDDMGLKTVDYHKYQYNHVQETKAHIDMTAEKELTEGVKAWENYKNPPVADVIPEDRATKQADLDTAYKNVPKDYYTRNKKLDVQKLNPDEIDARVVDNAKIDGAAVQGFKGFTAEGVKEYAPGETAQIKEMDLLDGKKANLSNLTKLEAQLEKEAADKLDTASKSQGVLGKLKSYIGFGKIEEQKYSIENDALKGGILEGNYGTEGEGASRTAALGSAKTAVTAAKEELISKRYDSAGDGVYYHKEIGRKMNRGALDDFGIKDVSWEKGDGDSVMGTFQHEGENHRINASYGKNNSIDSINISKFDGKDWKPVDDAHGLSKLTSAGAAKSQQTLAESNVKTRGILSKAIDSVKSIMPDKEIQAIKKEMKPDIKALKEANKAINKYNGSDPSALSQQVQRAGELEGRIQARKDSIDGIKSGRKLGNTLDSATESIAKDKKTIKAEREISKEEIKNFNKMKSTINATTENARVNTGKIVDSVSGIAGKVEQNVGAMAGNAPKGMGWFAKAAIAGMAFGALKAINDNSTEQRRQKQLELMSLRQQYGSSITSY